MGLYDRDYTQEGGGHYRERPQMRLALPSLTPVVKWLLIINVGVFIAPRLLSPLRSLEMWFVVDTRSLGTILQFWRFVSYQFLHADLGHLFFNMLMLYMMGTILERHWGSKRFLRFYLGCGIAGALFYSVLACVGWLGRGFMVGASGSILGVLSACAILFPQIRLYVYGIFPIPIRVLALTMIGLAVLTILQGEAGRNAGGEAAHLGGMVAGALYVLSTSWRYKVLGGYQQRRAQQQRRRAQNRQASVDQILEKVHQHGIHCLTQNERKILKQATESEQQRKPRY